MNVLQVYVSYRRLQEIIETRYPFYSTAVFRKKKKKTNIYDGQIRFAADFWHLIRLDVSRVLRGIAIHNLQSNSSTFRRVRFLCDFRLSKW